MLKPYIKKLVRLLTPFWVARDNTKGAIASKTSKTETKRMAISVSTLFY